MTFDTLRSYCLSLPHTVEDIKWGNDLCFTVGEKMYCVTRLEGDFACSLKVRADQFDELISRNNIVKAPYLGRYKWIFIDAEDALSSDEWNELVHQSYRLVFEKLPKKVKSQLNSD